MASTGLSKTFSTNGTNNKKGTFSFWMKRTGLTEVNLGMSVAGAAGGTAGLYIPSSNKLYMYLAYDGSGWQGEFITNRLFRDTNAYYHIVLTWDTTQATSSDRLKLYVNGVQETSFQSISYPPQDNVTTFGTARAHTINYWNNGAYFDGVMSHFHYTDGYSYDASAFGQFDANGVWTIKTDVSVTYGTNGFFILKDGNSVTDQSGNSNNWTVASGTLTNTEDNPSNVFCTMNPLDKSSSLTLSNGNTTTISSSASWMPCKATIGMLGQSGKFYWEGKCLSGTNHYFGVYDASGTVRGSVQSDMDSNRFVYVYNGGFERTITGQSSLSGYATFGNGDVIGVALDKENGTITFYKNGTQIYTETHSSLQTKDLIPGTQSYNSTIQWNFGNGYFGTTAVASAGTNASGIGIFEYDVPTGYTALSTKGLNL